MKREREAGAPAETASPKAEERSILVVDDDLSVREMLSRVLSGEGYHVRAAANGAQALEIAAAESIDLVLLDLNMPGKSGWETFEGLRKDHPGVPVVIITARSNQTFTALGAGVGALMEKPLDFPTLLETVGRLLEEPAVVTRARSSGQPTGTSFRIVRRKDTE